MICTDLYVRKIGKMSKVTVTPWRGDLLFHIRKYDVNNGRDYPLPEGIALSMSQWVTLEFHTRQIEEWLSGMVEGKTIELGDNVRVTIDKKFPGVDIRQFYWCGEKECTMPTRKGYHLNIDQFFILKECFGDIFDTLPRVGEELRAYRKVIGPSLSE